MTIIKELLLMVVLGRMEIALSVSCGAAAGTSSPRPAVQRTVSGTAPISAIIMLAFVF